MKYLKILGLLAVAASAMMAFAGSASATTLTSPAGTHYLGTIHAESEGHAVLHNPIAKIECPSTVEGHVIVNGGGPPTQDVTVELTTVDFGPCTNSWHVTTSSAGHLTIRSNGDGTADVFSTGATVESTRFGVTCRYATNSTTIGTLTAGGAMPTLHISAAIPFHSGSPLCGSGATTWTGSYTVTNPSTGVID